MPFPLPEKTPTQSYKERDASVNNNAHLSHEVNEVYLGAGDFVGTGAFSYATNPPSFDIGNGKTANAVFPKPSYWWNGKLELKIITLVSDTGTETADVDLVVTSHRIGTAGDVTTLYSSASATIDYTANGSANYIYEDDVITDEPVVEEDDLIHIYLINNGSIDLALVAIEVEYLPEYQQ